MQSLHSVAETLGVVPAGQALHAPLIPARPVGHSSQCVRRASAIAESDAAAGCVPASHVVHRMPSVFCCAAQRAQNKLKFAEMQAVPGSKAHVDVTHVVRLDTTEPLTCCTSTTHSDHQKMQKAQCVRAAANHETPCPRVGNGPSVARPMRATELTSTAWAPKAAKSVSAKRVFKAWSSFVRFRYT